MFYFVCLCVCINVCVCFLHVLFVISCLNSGLFACLIAFQREGEREMAWIEVGGRWERFGRSYENKTDWNILYERNIFSKKYKKVSVL